MNRRNLQRNHAGSKRSLQGAPGDPRSAAPPPPQDHASRRETRPHSEGDSDSSVPSPMRERFLSSDLEASGEESDLRPRPGKTAVWIVRRQKVSGSLPQHK